jgi:hypothetical protein
MEVVDAKQQAKLILKEMMDQHPGDPDLIAIWDVWFERMADGVHLVYLTPAQLAELKQRFDEAYAELHAFALTTLLVLVLSTVNSPRNERRHPLRLYSNILVSGLLKKPGRPVRNGSLALAISEGRSREKSAISRFL